MIRSMILAAAIFAAGNVPAQDSKAKAPVKQEHNRSEARKDIPPGERASREAERMAKQLALSEEQQEKWRLAVLERQQAHAPLREKYNGSTTPAERQELRRQMKAAREAFHSNVNSFLTEEQKKKLDEEWEKKREHHRKKGHKPHPQKSK